MNDRNEFDAHFADRVANLCYKKFASLPKSGKPVPGKEWTLLAAIIKYVAGNLEIVSMATGSKCLGSSKISCDGHLINDSHAEVLARRGFMRYLYEEISSLKQKRRSEILLYDEDSGRYALQDGVSFHLLTSHIPCGDASIFPKSSSEVSSNEFSDSHKIVKKPKLDIVESGNVGNELSDINRTGAKCLLHSMLQDKKQPGAEYHVVGVVRTKPGRGDPTLSVSCSDKILRWNCIGVEGALLSIFLLEPIHFSSIIVASHANLFCYDAMKRAVICRNETVEQLCETPPHLLHSSLEFSFCKRLSDSRTKPTACSIIWCKVQDRNHEVCVEGRRLGWTKKKCNTIKPLLITKAHFLYLFKSLMPESYNDFTYLQVKQLASRYRELSEKFKNSVGGWTTKNNDLLLFK